MTGTQHVFEWTNERNDTGKCQPPQPGISFAVCSISEMPGRFLWLEF